jgi:predicted DNA-binding protein (UPF0251 family)
MDAKQSNSDKVKEAYEVLYDKGLIHSKSDMAAKMGISRISVSLAVNGDEKYATDNFLRKIYETFPSVFNPNWIMGDSDDMLIEESPSKKKTPEQDLIALAASLIKEVEALRLSLSEEIKQTLALRQELTEALRDIRMTAAISNGTLKSQYLAERQPSNDSSEFAPPASQPYHVKSKKSV